MIIFPLYFVSGVFIPESEIPSGVLHVADVFPVRHLFDALLTGFNPATAGAGFELGNLAVVAAWGLAGLGGRREPVPVGTADIGCVRASPRQRRCLGSRAERPVL